MFQLNDSSNYVEEYSKGMLCELSGNLSEAFEHYISSANQGYAAAQCVLARIYKNGTYEIVQQNLTEAVRFYTLAANDGYWCAQEALANIYKTGIEGKKENGAEMKIEKNIPEAVRLYTLLLDQEGWQNRTSDKNKLMVNNFLFNNGHMESFDNLIQTLEFYKFSNCYVKNIIGENLSLSNEGNCNASFTIAEIYMKTNDFMKSFMFFKRVINQSGTTSNSLKESSESRISQILSFEMSEEETSLT